MSSKVKQRLKNRRCLYGSYRKLSKTNKKMMLELFKNAGHLSSSEFLSLFMIMHKITRILHGKRRRDNWVDIIGYSQLVIKNKEK